MNPDNSAFVKLLLGEVRDSNENIFREYLADLHKRYFFPETLPEYFQSTTKKYFFGRAERGVACCCFFLLIKLLSSETCSGVTRMLTIPSSVIPH